MKNRYWRWTALVVPAMALVLVVGAAPAGAAIPPSGSGSGSGTGTFTYQHQVTRITPPFCTAIAAMYSGSWTGTISNGTDTYSGPLKVNMTYAGFGNPMGTYLDPSCTLPGAVPVLNATVTDSSGGSSASCNMTGSYDRFGGPSSQAYTIQLVGTCAVNGVAAPAPAGMTWTGTLGTCSPSSGPPNTCSSTDSYMENVPPTQAQITGSVPGPRP